MASSKVWTSRVLLPREAWRPRSAIPWLAASGVLVLSAIALPLVRRRSAVARGEEGLA